MTQPKEQDALESNFIVFDTIKSKRETDPPNVFFFHALTQNNGKKMIEAETFAGLLIGFIQVTKLFTEKDPCNYISTNLHEIALLELANNVWIAVCREKTDNRNPKLLISLLQICRDVYKLFFPLPERDDSSMITRESSEILKAAFTMISTAVSWKDINFLNIFKSTFQITLPISVMRGLSNAVKTVLSTGAFISHIMILFSRYTMFSTLPLNVSTTLSICMKQKLQYLFPRKVESIEDKLFWVIGLSMSERNFVSVYAPNVIIDGREYPMICLKKNKLKVVLLLNPDIQPTPETLSRIPRIISPVVKTFSSLNMVTKKGELQGSYIVVKNNLVNRQLEMANEKLSDPQIPFVEHSIVNTSHCIHEVNSECAEVGIPVGDGFVAYAKYTKKMEDIVLFKSDKSVYDSLGVCKDLIKPGGCRRAEIV